MGGPFGSNIKMFLVGIWLIEPVCSNQANASPLFEGGALILAAALTCLSWVFHWHCDQVNLVPVLRGTGVRSLLGTADVWLRLMFSGI